MSVSIKKKLGVIGNRKNNTMELRILSWYNKPEKYDIRGWYDYNGEERFTKGISISQEEANEIYNILADIDFSEKKIKVFGKIQQGKNEIVVQLTKYGYDIRLFSDSYSIKSVTLNTSETETLRDILGNIFAREPVEAPKKPINIDTITTKETTEDEKIIHALTSIPVNDGNYPIKKATVNQLKAAILKMEMKPSGNKTRLTRCKAKLKQLESLKSTDKIVEKNTDEHDIATKISKLTVKEKIIEPSKETGNIIKFPKKDTTTIKRLQPTNKHHSYEEAEAKLNKEREMFKGDRDTEYVIDGILEACVSDQEFLDNVMRPEKSYIGAFQYFANKAREGYCMRVGNVAVMTADTALKYAIDYFNSEEPKKPIETKKNTLIKATSKGAKK